MAKAVSPSSMPTRPLSLNELVVAIKWAFSQSGATKSLNLPTDSALDTLLSHCFVAQANFLNNSRRVALRNATAILNEVLETAQERVHLIAALRRSLWNFPVSSDETGEFADLMDTHGLDQANSFMGELAAISDGLDAMQGAGVLQIKFGGTFETWRHAAPSLADAFVAAVGSSNKPPGRLNLPSRFLVALMPRLTGDAPTVAQVRQQLASTSKKEGAPKQEN